MDGIVEQFIKKMQNIYNNQRKLFKINFRGEFSLLIYLFRNFDNEITPGNISEDLNISTARVAASLNSLESKNYISREIAKDDRRKIIIKLTNKGKDKANCLKEERLRYIGKILSEFEESEVKEIIRLVNKLDFILENIEENEVKS